ncbi:hypothetical protein C8J56DRAFT_288025 [Mycena floridula]|nr:hypothetical protein C8J56DRAFT_288025 [Mycena floridula]
MNQTASDHFLPKQGWKQCSTAFSSPDAESLDDTLGVNAFEPSFQYQHTLLVPVNCQPSQPLSQQGPRLSPQDDAKDMSYETQFDIFESWACDETLPQAEASEIKPTFWIYTFDDIVDPMVPSFVMHQEIRPTGASSSPTISQHSPSALNEDWSLALQHHHTFPFQTLDSSLLNLDQFSEPAISEAPNDLPSQHYDQVDSQDYYDSSQFYSDSSLNQPTSSSSHYMEPFTGFDAGTSANEFDLPSGGNSWIENSQSDMGASSSSNRPYVPHYQTNKESTRHYHEMGHIDFYSSEPETSSSPATSGLITPPFHDSEILLEYLRFYFASKASLLTIPRAQFQSFPGPIRKARRKCRAPPGRPAQLYDNKQNMVKCQWGGVGFCFVPEMTAEQVVQHLRFHHGVIMKGFCEWEGCNTKTFLKDLDKHVKRSHLRLFRAICKSCGLSFTRPEALHRHRTTCDKMKEEA